MLHIFVDADACPVKEEVFRVARRYGLKVTLVANSRMRTPVKGWIELVVVGERFDAADDWIVAHVEEGDIVISGDIPLAARCLKKGALVIGPAGRAFDENTIGSALATRELLGHLRDMGDFLGGSMPFMKKDRSRFLQTLDETVQALRGRR